MNNDSFIKNTSQYTRVFTCVGSDANIELVKHIAWLNLTKRLTSLEHCLVLSNNNKGVESFIYDYQSLINTGDTPETKTFHSFALMLCKLLSSRGYIDEFELVNDDSELKHAAKSALNTIIKKNNQIKLFSSSKKLVDCFIHFISLMKANVEKPIAVFKYYKFDQELLFFIKSYQYFEEIRKKKKVKYFHDLVKDLVEALESKPHVLDKIVKAKTHIFVNDAEDLTCSQYRLLKLLCSKQTGLMFTR